MRGTRAKALRRLAKWERSAEIGVIERELVRGKNGSAVQSPDGLRAMYLKLKLAYRRITVQSAQKPAPMVTRVRRRSPPCPMASSKPLSGGPATFQRPMRHLLAAFPAQRRPDGTLEVNPTLLKARAAADRGDGATVQQLARLFA